MVGELGGKPRNTRKAGEDKEEDKVLDKVGGEDEANLPLHSNPVPLMLPHLRGHLDARE